MAHHTLAVAYPLYDGALTLWVMPYATHKAGRVIDAFEAVVPREKWGNYENSFLMIEGALIDVDFQRDSPTERPLAAQAWEVYWQARNGDLAHNYDAFSEVAYPGMVEGFWEAFNAVRSEFAPPEERQTPPEGADPNGSRTTSKRKRPS